MRERPIIFSGSMVRAILDGHKTQTRRVVKPQPIKQHWIKACHGYESEPQHQFRTPLPEFQLLTNHSNLVSILEPPHGRKGDRLWVREAFRLSIMDPDGGDYREDPDNFDAVYDADPAPGGGWRLESVDQDAHLSSVLCAPPRVRPAHLMPRRFSRLTLEITDVRVERVQDISEPDAEAEGCSAVPWGTWWQGYRQLDDELIHQQRRGHEPPEWMIEPKRMKDRPHLSRSARDEFRHLWESLNAQRGHGWDVNPWVWVLTFRRPEARNALGTAGCNA